MIAAEVDLVGLVDQVGPAVTMAGERVGERPGLILNVGTPVGDLIVTEVGHRRSELFDVAQEPAVVGPQPIDPPPEAGAVGPDLGQQTVGALGGDDVFDHPGRSVIDGHGHAEAPS